MIWKRVTEYMVTIDSSIRREIKKDMKQYINDDASAKTIYNEIGTDADCSCNDYHYSQRGLIYLQKKEKSK